MDLWLHCADALARRWRNRQCRKRTFAAEDEVSGLMGGLERAWCAERLDIFPRVCGRVVGA